LAVKYKIHPEMIEVARLTREGRLAEATSLIQRLLHGGYAAKADRIEPKPEAVIGAVNPRAAQQTSALGRRGVREWVRALKDKSAPIDGSELTALPSTQSKFAAAVINASGRSPFTSHELSNAAGSRSYKLFIPSGYRGKPLPLIVMLHGCSQTADDFATGTQMNVVAEERAFFVVYPEQSSAANASKCWNWFKPADQKRDAGEPSMIVGIVRQISADYAIDQKRIYATGLSAGGAAAAVLGATYPDVFAAVGVHSGLACGAASDMASAFAAMTQGRPLPNSGRAKSVMFHGRARRVPTIVFHGDKDTTVHPRNADNVISQVLSDDVTDLRKVSKNGRAGGGHAYNRTCYFDGSGREVIELWTVHGGGHAWSGGNRAGSFADPQGPDASREMARFFLSHAHP
jgi:poly(hydroxyalkanoate) depolymerase family esterase